MKLCDAAVIGANFGDEGKGLVVDWLAATGKYDAVARFNGGGNAGHTVQLANGQRHVFRNFGSGTLRGLPTLYYPKVVANPILFMEEYQELASLGYRPEVYIDPDCMVTTFVDMMVNQMREAGRGDGRHGSCGVGLHDTITRNQVPALQLTMGDLWSGRSIRPILADIVHKWAPYLNCKILDPETAITKFIEACGFIATLTRPLGSAVVPRIIFEGAQGLMLDMDNATMFPHVTHSKTDLTNIIPHLNGADLDVFFVSRTYLTRHGAGPLPQEDPTLSYEDHTNKPNQWQGTLRFAPLDYAALLQRCHKVHRTGDHNHLVMTHADQYEMQLGWQAHMISYGPRAEDMTLDVT